MFYRTTIVRRLSQAKADTAQHQQWSCFSTAVLAEITLLNIGNKHQQLIINLALVSQDPAKAHRRQVKEVIHIEENASMIKERYTQQVIL